MEHLECWKCGEYFDKSSGKISKSNNFTCFPCLKLWWKSLAPERRQEYDSWVKAQNKRRVDQMDIFEAAETLHTIFPSYVFRK